MRKLACLALWTSLSWNVLAADPVAAPPAPTPTTTPTASAAANAPMALVDLFSVEKNMGRGTLEYTKGTEKEKILFGPETGHYILAMVFPQETLPTHLRQELKNNEVIQLALGTLSGSTAGRVGQFGAATLMVSKGLRSQRMVPLRIPGGSEGPLPESGFLLFTSPMMQAQITDEEKLKGTYFAKGGSVSLSASGVPKSIEVAVDGKKIPFKMQAMRAELLATLVTPFNSQENQVHGRIEFPMYWPEGPLGKRLARQLADGSFGTKNTLHIPEEVAPKRQVTGTLKNPPPPKKR